MARIQINDLPVEQQLEEHEMRRLYGGFGSLINAILPDTSLTNPLLDASSGGGGSVYDSQTSTGCLVPTAPTYTYYSW